MKNIKTWIDIRDGEVSIQVDYRHILHIDINKRELCVFDIRKGTLRDIPWQYQTARIDRISDLIAEARHEADLTPETKPKAKGKVSGQAIMDAIAENAGKNQKDPKIDPIDVLGQLISGDNWLTDAGLQTDEETAGSTLQKCLNKRRGKITHVAQRLILWTTSELKVSIWMLNSDTKQFKSRSMRRTSKYRLSFVKEGIGIRQNCALAEMDYKFVKVLDKSLVKRSLSQLNKKKIADAEEAFREAGEEFDSVMADQLKLDLDSWLNTEGWNGDGHGYSMSDDKMLQKVINKQILPEYTAKGYTFIGGNPDSGIMVFVKKPLVSQAQHGQKLAKILLRGGIQLSAGGSMDTIEAMVVDMPSTVDNPTEQGGYRDGVFMIMKRSIFRMLGQENGFKPGASWQASLYQKETSAMKGMIVAAGGKDHPEMALLLNGKEAVVDLKLYNEIYKAETKAGDVVEIPVDAIWVMNIDRDCEPVEMHLSAQAVRRAPEALSNYFHALNMEYLEKMLTAASDEDKRALMEYMPSYGDYAPFKAAGLKPVLKPEWNVNKKGEFDKANPIKGWHIDPFLLDTMVQNVIRANAKGYKIALPKDDDARKAFYLRTLHDNSLSVKTDKHNHVGISMPKASGLKIGDKTIIVTYPALNAGDNTGTVSIFVAVVEKLTTSAYVGLHGVAAQNALRDEDGDKIHIIVPSKDDWKNHPEMEKCGMSFINVSVKDKTAKNTKRDIFEKEISHNNVIKSSLDMLAVYMKLATNVGIADNRKTSEELYLGERAALEGIVTPTGEDVKTYLSRFVQDSIENKKHITLEEYGVIVHDAWSKLTIPEAWEYNPRSGKRDKFNNHPELACQKLRHEDGSMVLGNEGTMEMVELALQKLDESGLKGSKWIKLIRKGCELKVTEDGFVHPDYYKEIGQDMLIAFGDDLVRQDESKDNLHVLVDTIIDGNRAIIQGSDAKSRFNEAREFLFKNALIMKHSFSLAERLFLNIAMLEAGSPAIWSQVCNLDFLKMVAHFGDNPDDMDSLLSSVGFTKRNTIRAEKEYKEQLNKMSSDRVATRLWVKKDDGPLPLISEKMVIEVNNFLTEVEGKKINLSDDTYCSHGFYEITKVEEYTTRDGNISDTNLYVWLKK